MTFLQHISKKQSVLQWLILAILSSGISAFQESGYHERQKYTNAVHQVERRTTNVSQVQNIFDVSEVAQVAPSCQFNSKNLQLFALKAFSKTVDAFTIQRLIQFPARFTSIRTGSIQHFLCRTFASEEAFNFHS